MIHITNKEDCCGCHACGDVCAHSAITFEIDHEGFWYPKVNRKLCVECGLCEQVCPMLYKLESSGKYREPRVFGAYSKDEHIRMDSTSGGVQTALAMRQYAAKGYVGGAVFNEDHTVRHIVSPDEGLLPKLRSSKYLQSEMKGLYNEIRRLLRGGANVMFCAAPCQIQALRNFLKKDYDNLFAVDFVCLGVNSPKVFLAYMKMLEDKYGSKAVLIKFKDKKRGWHNFSMRVNFEDGQEYCKARGDDTFFIGYLDHLYTRPSCYGCKFRTYPHNSDLTLADFWGIDTVDKEMDQDKGTSLLLVNNDRGMTRLDMIKESLVWKEYDMETLHQNYGDMFVNSPKPIKSRPKFFADLDKYPFDVVSERNLSMPTKKKAVLKRLRLILTKLKKICSPR